MNAMNSKVSLKHEEREGLVYSDGGLCVLIIGKEDNMYNQISYFAELQFCTNGFSLNDRTEGLP